MDDHPEDVEEQTPDFPILDVLIHQEQEEFVATKDLAKDDMEDEAVIEDLTEQAGHEETHHNEDEFVAPTTDNGR